MALTLQSRSLAGAVRAAPRRAVVAAAVSRPTWYPGATPPKHLDGSMMGDYGDCLRRDWRGSAGCLRPLSLCG